MPTRFSVRIAAATVAACITSPLLAAAPDGQLVTFNDNGIWCWFQDDRVIVDQATGQLLVTSIASGDGVGGTARDSKVEIVSYNLNTNAVSAPTMLIDWKATLGIIADDHNVPALHIRPDGRYVATYAAHQNDSRIRTRVSTNPGDATSWGPENVLTVTSNQGTTYSNVYKLSSTGVTYDFYRGNNYDPHVLTSTDDGSTYAYTGHLLMDPANSSGGRPYLRYASNGVDKIFFSTSTGHPRDGNTGVFVGYLGANNRLYNLNGTDLGGLGTNTGTAVSASTFTPVLPANTVVNGTTRTHGWTTDIQLDGSGNPYMGFTSRVASSTADHRFYYSRWNGSALVTNEVARAGGFLYSAEPDYTGLMALSPSDPNTLYISTKIDPRDSTGGTTTAKYEIYRGFTTDTGATWQWVPITVGSTDDNLRPTLPTWDDTHSALVWMKGTYTTYQRANMAMVGKFYTGNNGRWTNASGGTWTTAGNWTDGRQADGMSFIADFSTLDVNGVQTVSLGGTSRTLGFLAFGDTNLSNGGAWTINNGTLRLDGGVVAPSILVKNQKAQIDAVIDGVQGLTKIGTGALVLGGQNTYSGDTTVSAGILGVYGGNAIPDDSAVSLATGTRLNVMGDETIAAVAGAGAIELYAGATLTTGGNNASTALSGVISGSGALVKTGAGTLALAAANTFTGGTTVRDGTLSIGGGSALADSGAVVVDSGATLNVFASETIGSLAGGGNVALGNGGTLTQGGNGASTVFAGTISGNATLTKLGTGTLTLSGTNSYTGPTNIYAGAISVSSIADSTGTNNTINLGSGAGAGTLIYTGSGEVTPKSIYLSTGAAINGGTIDMSGTGTLRFTAPTLAATSFQPHTLTLQGSTSGVGQVDGVISNGSSTNKTTVLKRGSGRWVLAGDNTYTGPTIVEDGTLQVMYRSSGTSAASPLLTGAGGVDLQGGSVVFDYAGDSSPATTIRSLLAAGFTAGSGVLNTGQIRSTTATSAKGLGYLDDGTNVLVKVALFGDVDLDGGVSINDFSLLANNFGGTNKLWTDGDVDYDGSVSIDDFNLLAGNFGQTLPTASNWAPLIAFAAANGGLVEFERVTGVPEPSLAGLAAMATGLVLRRRRRHA